MCSLIQSKSAGIRDCRIHKLSLSNLAIHYTMKQHLQKEMKNGWVRTMKKMNAKTTVCLSAAIAALVAGCQVAVGPPVVAVSAPAPAVEVIPPTYVWDGVEFVGEYNGGFVYLGPGGVWLPCGPEIRARFDGWARIHPDWRRNGIRYDRAHRPDPRRGPVRREEERR
jgi:hypothetical protein